MIPEIFRFRKGWKPFFLCVCFTNALSFERSPELCGCWRAFDGRTAASIQPLAAFRRACFVRRLPSFLSRSRKVSPSLVTIVFRRTFQGNTRDSGKRRRELCLLSVALPSPGVSYAVPELLNAARLEPEAYSQRVVATTSGARNPLSSSPPQRRPLHLSWANRFPVIVRLLPDGRWSCERVKICDMDGTLRTV